MLLMQARCNSPLTSISQAPQLPPRQPVGMLTPAALASASQSPPGCTWLQLPQGQRTVMELWWGDGSISAAAGAPDSHGLQRHQLVVPAVARAAERGGVDPGPAAQDPGAVGAG